MTYPASVRLSMIAGLVAVMSGCAEDPADAVDGTQAVQAANDPAKLAEVADASIDAYAQALLDRDVKALDALLSSEVHERIDQMESDTAGFAEKMRASMLVEFPGIAEGSKLSERFGVSGITQEEGALRVEIAFDGKALPKPFYFVSEDGAYKLNLLPPGFTKATSTAYAAARDRYLVRNNNPLAPSSGVSIRCTGGSVTVPPGGSRYVSCSNTCGWWHGSVFSARSSASCDYNTWGVDAYIDDRRAAGFYCNDRC